MDDEFHQWLALRASLSKARKIGKAHPELVKDGDTLFDLNLTKKKIWLEYTTITKVPSAESILLDTVGCKTLEIAFFEHLNDHFSFVFDKFLLKINGYESCALKIFSWKKRIIDIIVDIRGSAIMGILLRHNIISPNEEYSPGMNLLQLFCFRQDYKKVSMLLHHGASTLLNMDTDSASSPMHLTLSSWYRLNSPRSSLSCLNLLLNHARCQQQLVSTDGNMRIPFHLACLYGDLEACRLLLQYGSKSDINDSESYYPVELCKSDNARRIILGMIERFRPALEYKHVMGRIEARAFVKHIFQSVFVQKCHLCSREQSKCDKMKREDFKLWLYFHEIHKKTKFRK